MNHLLLLFFLLATLSDVATVHWHSAREADRIVATSALSVLLECLTWLPVWFALSEDDYRIAVVSVVGSAVGTALGMARVRRKRGGGEG